MKKPPEDTTETNGPAHKRIPVAVALKHDRAADGAPRVVATGRGAVAEQIIEIAFARGIKVREDADLVEILAAIELESEIPIAAFAAVAEILSYLYRLNRGATGSMKADGE